VERKDARAEDKMLALVIEDCSKIQPHQIWQAQGLGLWNIKARERGVLFVMLDIDMSPNASSWPHVALEPKTGASSSTVRLRAALTLSDSATADQVKWYNHILWMDGNAPGGITASSDQSKMSWEINAVAFQHHQHHHTWRSTCASRGTHAMARICPCLWHDESIECFLKSSEVEDHTWSARNGGRSQLGDETEAVRIACRGDWSLAVALAVPVAVAVDRFALAPAVVTIVQLLGALALALERDAVVPAAAATSLGYPLLAAGVATPARLADSSTAETSCPSSWSKADSIVSSKDSISDALARLQGSITSMW
jgi:hypothetical protein